MTILYSYHKLVYFFVKMLLGYQKYDKNDYDIIQIG